MPELTRQSILRDTPRHRIYKNGRGVEDANLDFGAIRRVASAIYVAAILIASTIAHDIQTWLGFVAILTMASIPFFIWTKRGALQLPIFPVVALFYVPSYANAGRLETTGSYSPDQILAGELTVALFLAAAEAVWLFFVLRAPPRIPSHGRGHVADERLRTLMIGGLLVGAIFETGTLSGWWGWMGTAYGTFRTCASSAILLGCFVYGVVLGRRQLSGMERTVGGVLLIAILILEASSLLLYSAILNFISVCLGYFQSGRKVPWAVIAVGLLIATTLHSGKSQMRGEYWTNGMSSTSLSEVPEIMSEWFRVGINNMVYGAPEDQQSLAERASLLPNLLLIQQSSPYPIPYLDGATYANFSRMLVPRFVASDKISSQENLHILGVRYGLQTAEGVTTTTLSFGLVSEGYANFGALGVVLAGLAFGALMGWLTYWTTGAPTVSLRGFVGIASMVVPIMSVAYDFGYMLLNLLQSIVTVVLLFLCVDSVFKRSQ